MSRFWIAASCVLAVMAGAAPAAAQATDPGEARRLALAERYLELGQGAGAAKTMKGLLEDAFMKSDMAAEERTWLAQNLAETIEQALEETFRELRDEVADLFTEAELEASVAFMETPMGQSIVNKQVELGFSLQEQMAPHLVAGMTRLQGKYCARFDCEEASSAAPAKR
jgi:hypothetical protein